MKKSDVKVGMRIEFRDSSHAYIVDRLNGHYDTYLSTINGHYTDDLLDGLFADLDIMKVYDENGKLIWEREA